MKVNDEIIGSKIGLWEVKKRVANSRNGKSLFECVCDCGNVKHVFGCHLKSGSSKSCGCNLAKGNKHKQWRGHGDISGNFWDNIRRGSDGSKGRCPIDFSITIEYIWNLFLKQNKKCALSGLPIFINFARKTGGPHNASLDRIDSSLGYIPNNVQWLHKDVNMMKRNYDQNYFLDLCLQISEHSKTNE
jgi:hypothetical protein